MVKGQSVVLFYNAIKNKHELYTQCFWCAPLGFLGFCCLKLRKRVNEANADPQVQGLLTDPETVPILLDLLAERYEIAGVVT